MKIDSSFLTSNRVGPALMQTQESEPASRNTGFAGGFENIFNDLWDATSELSDISRAKRADLVTGNLDSLPELMVASEKSGLMFDFNMSVRNKVMDAYQEIMRTQI